MAVSSGFFRHVIACIRALVRGEDFQIIDVNAQTAPPPFPHFEMNRRREDVSWRSPSSETPANESPLQPPSSGKAPNIGDGCTTEIGLVTFDDTIYFHPLDPILSPQPQLVVCGDCEDPFCPLPPEALCINAAENVVRLEQTLDFVQDAFKADKASHSVAAAAARAAAELLASRGGGVLVLCICSPPTSGIGALTGWKEEANNPGKTSALPRAATLDVGGADGSRLLASAADLTSALSQSASTLLNTKKLPGAPGVEAKTEKEGSWSTRMAAYCREKNVSLDVFCGTTANVFVDLAIFANVTAATGGHPYYYPDFSVQRHGYQLYFDMLRSVSVLGGFSCLLKLRCSRGLSVSDKLHPYPGWAGVSDLSTAAIPRIAPWSALAFVLKHDGKLEALTETGRKSNSDSQRRSQAKQAYLQCACLYTSPTGRRLLRIITRALDVTSNLSSVYRYAEVELAVLYLYRRSIAAAFHHFRKSRHEKGARHLAGAGETSTELLTAGEGEGFVTHLMHSLADTITRTSAGINPLGGNATTAGGQAVLSPLHFVLQFCVDVLTAYRVNCTSTAVSGQLILPESMKCLLLYALCIAKRIQQVLGPLPSLFSGVELSYSMTPATQWSGASSAIRQSHSSQPQRPEERVQWLRHGETLSFPFICQPFLCPRIYCILHGSDVALSESSAGETPSSSSESEPTTATKQKANGGASSNAKKLGMGNYTGVGYDVVLPPLLAASGEKLSSDGIYLFDTDDAYRLYIGEDVPRWLIEQLIGVEAADHYYAPKQTGTERKGSSTHISTPGRPLHTSSTSTTGCTAVPSYPHPPNPLDDVAAAAYANPRPIWRPSGATLGYQTPPPLYLQRPSVSADEELSRKTHCPEVIWRIVEALTWRKFRVTGNGTRHAPLVIVPANSLDEVKLFSTYLVEDAILNEPSYVDYLCQVHRMVQKGVEAAM